MRGRATMVTGTDIRTERGMRDGHNRGDGLIRVWGQNLIYNLAVSDNQRRRGIPKLTEQEAMTRYQQLSPESRRLVDAALDNYKYGRCLPLIAIGMYMLTELMGISETLRRSRG